MENSKNYTMVQQDLQNKMKWTWTETKRKIMGLKVLYQLSKKRILDDVTCNGKYLYYYR
jgi:hypothetical protein